MRHYLFICFLLLLVSCESVPKFMQCDNCDGEGKVTKECPDCEGSGRKYF